MTIDQKINAIREKALGRPLEACPTCTRQAGAPYRCYDARGKVTEGCVDAHHTGQRVQPLAQPARGVQDSSGHA